MLSTIKKILCSNFLKKKAMLSKAKFVTDENQRAKLLTTDWRQYGNSCVAYRQKGDWDNADAAIELGLKHCGAIEELLIAYGDTAMDQHHWQEALRRWKKLIETFPQCIKGYERAIAANIELIHVADAAKILLDYLAIVGEKNAESQLTQYLLIIAGMAQREGLWEIAITLYNKYQQIFPNRIEGYGEACVAYRRMGEWEKADQTIEKGLTLLGNREELLIAYGDTAMDQKQWEKALQRWELAIRNLPPDEQIYEKAMVAARQCRKFGLAHEYYEALRLNIGLKEIDPTSFIALKEASLSFKKNKRICFVNALSDIYSYEATGHLKYLYEYLLRSGEQIEICWITDNLAEFKYMSTRGLPVRYQDVSQETLDYLLRTDIAIYQTHDTILNCTGIRQACLAGAIKVQLWHGIPAKRVGYEDTVGLTEISTLSRWIYDCMSFEYIISESEAVSEVYSKAFPGAKVVPLGGCRTDALIHYDSYADACKLPAKITSSKRMVLYAPTYREMSQDISSFISELRHLIDVMEEQNEFIFAIKPHPRFSERKVVDFEYLLRNKNNIVYINEAEDIYPLAAHASMLITDYSSIYLDYLITKRPIIFFCPDISLYDESRIRIKYACQTDIEVGPTIYNAIQLPQALSDATSATFHNNRDEIARHLHVLPHDGNATRRVAEFIVSLLRT